MITTGLMSSDTSEWATPQDLFDNLNREFGFTLDVCSTDANAKCARHFTKEDDGLTQPWDGHTCWMNPPYGREIGAWMEKAAYEGQRGNTVVCLVPARTDTKWWHDTVMAHAWPHGVRLLRGRVKFIRDDGATGAAPFPSAVVVFGGRR